MLSLWKIALLLDQKPHKRQLVDKFRYPFLFLNHGWCYTSLQMILTVVEGWGEKGISTKRGER